MGSIQDAPVDGTAPGILIPVGDQSASMSYVGKNGRQYIVMVTGGATRTGTNDNRGDYVIAYTLPE